jgi:hypothetical protein
MGNDHMAMSNRAQTIQVTIPAEVAFDLDRFHEVQKGILGKLGCMACCSGFDIRYDFQRAFVVDANLEIREAGFGM